MSARRKENTMSERNGYGRRTRLVATAAFTAVTVVTMPSAAHGAGAGYNVLQCHAVYRADHEIGWQGNGPYFGQRQCQSPAAQLSITDAAQANRNQGGQFTLTAPSGTAIREIHIDANLRRGSHHLAQIGVWNGSNVAVLANGPDSNPSWKHYDWGGLNHPQLVIRLYCDDGTCPADATAHVYVRNIHVVLTDRYDPSAPAIGGGLSSSGWTRGTQVLSASTADYGAGVMALSASVNGTNVAGSGACNTGGLGWNFSGYLVPCNGSASLSPTLDTRLGPFHDGNNAVVVTATDYAGNRSSTSSTVRVDNTAPAVAFANGQDPEDPELIRARVGDATSGLANAMLYLRQSGASEWTSLETKVEGAEARARVDSASLPAGEYEFRAVARDVARNSTETTRRQNGDEMRLAFPLRESVQLQAHLDNGASRGQTVPYGTDATAEGKLLDAQGEPIVGREITIVENFGEGALIRERVSNATTDEDGRWSSTAPAGPNRSITAAFEGTARYGATHKQVGTLVVRSRVSFKTKRESVGEGHAMTFTGKVGHFGARIPAGGKLLELQVRVKTGRWDTVGQAFRSEEDGTYKRRYRFGKHYTRDALFRFRVKLKNEANWPFRKAASKQRKVVVRAR
jgi:hypothetical protein